MTGIIFKISTYDKVHFYGNGYAHTFVQDWPLMGRDAAIRFLHKKKKTFFLLISSFLRGLYLRWITYVKPRKTVTSSLKAVIRHVEHLEKIFLCQVCCREPFVSLHLTYLIESKYIVFRQ